MTEPTPSIPPEPPSQHSQQQPHQAPLEYWHATGPRPLHPVLVSLCIFAGVFLGSVLSFGVVSLVGFSAVSAGSSWLRPVLVGSVVILIGVVFTVLSIRKVVKGSRLSIELRRRGPRYFLIGLLIGCGVACLLEGICFTGIGVASRS